MEVVIGRNKPVVGWITELWILDQRAKACAQYLDTLRCCLSGLAVAKPGPSCSFSAKARNSADGVAPKPSGSFPRLYPRTMRKSSLAISTRRFFCRFDRCSDEKSFHQSLINAGPKTLQHGWLWSVFNRFARSSARSVSSVYGKAEEIIEPALVEDKL